MDRETFRECALFVLRFLLMRFITVGIDYCIPVYSNLYYCIVVYSNLCRGEYKNELLNVKDASDVARFRKRSVAY